MKSMNMSGFVVSGNGYHMSNVDCSAFSIPGLHLLKLLTNYDKQKSLKTEQNKIDNSWGAETSTTVSSPWKLSEKNAQKLPRNNVFHCQGFQTHSFQTLKA